MLFLATNIAGKMKRRGPVAPFLKHMYAEKHNFGLLTN